MQGEDAVSGVKEHSPSRNINGANGLRLKSIISGIKPLVGTAVYLKRDGMRMCGSAQAWQPRCPRKPRKVQVGCDDLSVSRD